MLILGSLFQGLLATGFVGFCLLLCLIILIQKPRGGGLSGAFGGAGGGQVFGGKSGDILTWITVGFFLVFLIVGMSLVIVTRNEARGLGVQTTPEIQPATPVDKEEPGGATGTESPNPEGARESGEPPTPQPPPVEEPTQPGTENP